MKESKELSVELLKTLSDDDFSSYHVLDEERKIVGYFSCYHHNQLFNYVVMIDDDDISEYDFYTFACNYVREHLGLEPILNPRYPIPCGE